MSGKHYYIYEDWHRPRVASLVAAGADLLALETIPAAKEATALMR